MRALAAGLALLAWAAPALADPDGVTETGRDLALEARAVALGPGDLAPGLALSGAWEIWGRDPAFGGLSGLLVEGDRLLAVTDRGAWVTARIDPAAPALLSEGRIAEMRDGDGRAFDADRGRDAEGLARLGGTLHVAFEKDQRVLAHLGAGRLGEARRPEGAERLDGNSGLEGLATLPDGRLFAIAEGRVDGAFPYWILGPEGARRGSLPARSKHDVTAADIGPDGRLYLAQRHYSMLEGVSLRLLRYELDAEGRPRPETATRLAAYDSASGIDNMEGLSVARAPDGALTLWLIADDNFNPMQRTLLLAVSLPR